VLVKHDDFLCYRGESSGSGDDMAAYLLRVFGLALQNLGAPRRCLGLCPSWCGIGRGVLERSHEAVALRAQAMVPGRRGPPTLVISGHWPHGGVLSQPATRQQPRR